MTWNYMDVKDPHFSSSSSDMSKYFLQRGQLLPCALTLGETARHTITAKAVFSVYEKGVDIVNGECTVFRRESPSIFLGKS